MYMYSHTDESHFGWLAGLLNWFRFLHLWLHRLPNGAFLVSFCIEVPIGCWYSIILKLFDMIVALLSVGIGSCFWVIVFMIVWTCEHVRMKHFWNTFGRSMLYWQERFVDRTQAFARLHFHFYPNMWSAAQRATTNCVIQHYFLFVIGHLWTLYLQ